MKISKIYIYACRTFIKYIFRNHIEFVQNVGKDRNIILNILYQMRITESKIFLPV